MAAGVAGARNHFRGLTLRNTGDAPLTVVGVETTASRIAGLHAMTHAAGMMRMRALDRLEVPAKSAITLQPHGNHLMLFDLKAPLVAGRKVPVSFVLDDGRRVTADFAVRTDAP